jgi:hypothetical protein
MKKYVVAGLLIAAFVTPALAEQFYVAFDPASHKCSMMHRQPSAGMRLMGTYHSRSAAHKAMASMKECHG